jgi:DNA polymerase-3 subunit beta
MKCEVGREMLARALERIAAVVAKKSTTAFRFALLTFDNELWLRGGDEDIQVVTWIGGEGQPGAVCVEPGALLAMLRAMDGQTVSLERSKSGLLVSCGRTRYTIPAVDGSDYPLADTIEQGPVYELEADALAEALGQVTFAVASEQRYGLNGVHLDISEHWNFVATDGHRLACSRPLHVPGETPSIRGLIPLRAASVLQRLSDGDPLRVTVGPTTWSVMQWHDSVWFRLIDGEFPDWRAIVPKEDQRHLVIVDRKVAIEVCKRVKVIVGSRQKGVKFKFDEAQCQIEVTASDEAGDIVESLPATITGGTFEAAFNAAYLLDALETLQGDAAYLTMAHSLAPAKITTEILGDSMHVVMPMRID